jgi:hypothetical protein
VANKLHLTNSPFYFYLAVFILLLGDGKRESSGDGSCRQQQTMCKTTTHEICHNKLQPSTPGTTTKKRVIKKGANHKEESHIKLEMCCHAMHAAKISDVIIFSSKFVCTNYVFSF